jgi:hypothetical protein
MLKAHFTSAAAKCSDARVLLSKSFEHMLSSVGALDVKLSAEVCAVQRRRCTTQDSTMISKAVVCTYLDRAGTSSAVML